MIYTQEYVEDAIRDLYNDNLNLRVIIDDLIKQNNFNNIDKNLICTGGEYDEF